MKKKTVVTAVVGSQLKHWPAHLRCVVPAIVEGIVLQHAPLPGEEGYIVTGDADGVDEWVVQACTKLGIAVVSLSPKFRRWEPEGFKDRNKEVAWRCQRLFCIRHPGARTYGSGWTADCAEWMKKEVFRIEVR